jgi:hypothetical protein
MRQKMLMNIYLEGKVKTRFVWVLFARRDGHWSSSLLYWLRCMFLNWSKVSIVFTSRTAIAELKACSQALEADESGLLLLTILAEHLLWWWDGVDGWRGSGGCLHVAHDGDVGDMGILAGQWALGAAQRLVVHMAWRKTLAAEGVATAHQETRLLLPTGSVGHLTHWTLQHGKSRAVDLVCACIDRVMRLYKDVCTCTLMRNTVCLKQIWRCTTTS